jgi:4-alpha-glucanotransferase
MSDQTAVIPGAHTLAPQMAVMNLGAPPSLIQELDRSVACDVSEGSRREWLATSGFGDYALGAVNGLATRRYHGLLVGASTPPIGRRMLVPFIDEDVTVGSTRHALATRRWSDGAVDPDGHRRIAGFHLEDGIPTTVFEVGPARIERRVLMLRGPRAVAVLWTLADAPSPVELDARIFVEHRGHHRLDPDAAWLPEVRILHGEGARAEILLPENEHAPTPTTLFVAADGATLAAEGVWWRRHQLAEERARGYDALGSACHALTATVILAPGETRGIVIGLGDCPGEGDPLRELLAANGLDAGGILARERARRQDLVERAGLASAPREIRSLAVAADDFIVRRRRRDGSDGRSIIAGYPWFEDWGRDAMLALPGLLLATRRGDEAKLVLATFLDHLDAGLLPNRFPDERAGAEYHSADAPLLAIVAATEVARATGDHAWLAAELPRLLSIADGYLAGTRHGIGIAKDGLVSAGERGLQLTWMDAKIGDLVVTPRAGKPIELSALWLAATTRLARFIAAHAPAFAEEGARLAAAAQRAACALPRYWNPSTQCFADLLDGPSGDDGAIRPNQLFLLALCAEHLPAAWRDDALATIQRELVVPLAVRTLARGAAEYRGRYEGDQRSRDLAYHNGTAWPFLLGLYLRALDASGSARAELLRTELLADLAARAHEGGIGSLPEIVDGDAPHTRRGCPMQAWSVGCVLEALLLPPAGRAR